RSQAVLAAVAQPDQGVAEFLVHRHLGEVEFEQDTSSPYHQRRHAAHGTTSNGPARRDHTRTGPRGVMVMLDYERANKGDLPNLRGRCCAHCRPGLPGSWSCSDSAARGGPSKSARRTTCNHFELVSRNTRSTGRCRTHSPDRTAADGAGTGGGGAVETDFTGLRIDWFCF